MEIFWDIFKQTLTITVFVLVMMLIIEYVNVRSRGVWQKPLSRSPFLQITVAAFLGVIPGCLGAYAVVAMFTHNIIGLGALISAMIATSGDEAFIMFATIPKQALYIHIFLFVLAIVAGLIVDKIFKNKFALKQNLHLQIHENEISCTQPKTSIIENFRKITFQRALLIFGIIVFLAFMLMGGGEHAHAHGESCDHQSVSFIDFHSPEGLWIKITFFILAVVALVMVATVSNHFLEEHFWGHIIKKHFLRIFLWVLGTMLFLQFIIHYFHFDSYISENKYWVMLLALLIGLIPESGPHMIFLALYIQGSLPVSILIANSIVQDGHGMLPLLAESKKSFIIVKLINFAIGAFVGYIGLMLGF